MAENRSDSNAELVTFTGQGVAARKVEINFISTVAPLAVEPLRSELTATEFACKVQDDWRKGEMPKAKTLTAALRQACKLYPQFKPDSLRELLRKHRAKLTGDPL